MDHLAHISATLDRILLILERGSPQPMEAHPDLSELAKTWAPRFQAVHDVVGSDWLITRDLVRLAGVDMSSRSASTELRPLIGAHVRVLGSSRSLRLEQRTIHHQYHWRILVD